MTSHLEFCAICRTDNSEGKIFSCSQCEKKCHQVRIQILIYKECYMYKDEEIKAFKINKCDVCRFLNIGLEEQKLRKDLKCVICDKNEGMMKKCIDDKKLQKWIHIKCAEWYNKILKFEFENGFNVYKAISKIESGLVEDCSKCKKMVKGDIIVKCQDKNCEKYFHTGCIESHLKGVLPGIPKTNTFYCEEHIKKKKNEDRTFGKNINSENILDPNAKRIVKDYDHSIAINNHEVIIPTVKPTQTEMKSDNLQNEVKHNLNKKVNTDSANKDKLKSRNNIEDADADFNEPSDLFISSEIKCDICTQRVNEVEQLKKCINCLTYYHFNCSKEFGEKEAQKKCKKCTVDKESTQQCIVCERNKGSMIRCDSKWVHILCASSLKRYFYQRKDQSSYTLCLETKQNKIKSKCQLCGICNCYTVKCAECDLTFHPYCGFLYNFEVICKENKGLTDLLNKYEFNFICERHDFFKEENDHKFEHKFEQKKRENENKKIKSHIKMIKRPEEGVRNRIKRVKLEKSVRIESFNYKQLKNLFLNTYKGEHFAYLTYTEWDWRISDNYFLPLNEEDINSLKNEPQELNSSDIIDNFDQLIYRSPNDIPNENKYIICNFNSEIKGKNKDLLAIYDISKINEMKLSPDFLSYKSLLDDIGNSEEYSFINKRQRSEEENFKNKEINNSLKNTKFKIIDDEPSNSNDLNSKNSSTKIKLFMNEGEGHADASSVNIFNSGNITNSLNNDIDSEMKNQSSGSFKIKKFLKKIKLKSYFKLRQKDKKVIGMEDTSKIKVKQLLKNNEKSFDSLLDIDKEILVKTEMLKSLTNENYVKLNEAFENILKSRKETSVLNEKEEVNKLMTTFRSVYRFGNIKRRLKKGVDDKSVDEILKNRSCGSKHLVTQEENGIKENSGGESECCVCFYSDSDDFSPIVFCDSCNVSVHQECYGIQEIPEGEYFCDLCSSKAKNLCKECVLCGNKRGAMKKLDKSGDDWAHVTCIILSHTLSFQDYSTMEEVRGFNSLNFIQQPLTKTNKCEICKKTNGELFQSLESNTYYHFLCAYLEGYKIFIKEEQSKEHKYFRRVSPIIYSFDPESEVLQSYFRKQKELRNSIYHKELSQLKGKKKGENSSDNSDTSADTINQLNIIGMSIHKNDQFYKLK